MSIGGRKTEPDDDVERVSEPPLGADCGPGLVHRGSVDPARVAAVHGAVLTVVLANPEVADKVRVSFLPSIPLFAFLGGAGGGFLGFLSPANGASS